MPFALDAALAAADAAAGTASAVAPFVVLAFMAVIAVAAILWSRARRRRAGDPAAESARGEEVRVLWGLHVPGTPVQRMAKSLAVGFIAIDPEETSQLVRSTDGGATWHVVPREQWRDAPE
ncbi:MAG: hypothetical protein J0H23_00485 [Micrococcales bacterium]|nr:hypothetical protein [Micrococcales bacterium]OJX66804.1 MAG: hypothetical protein BGO94_08190 [Micrococcales bacterium 72-143]